MKCRRFLKLCSSLFYVQDWIKTQCLFWTLPFHWKTETWIILIKHILNRVKLKGYLQFLCMNHLVMHLAEMHVTKPRYVFLIIKKNTSKNLRTGKGHRKTIIKAAQNCFLCYHGKDWSPPTVFVVKIIASWSCFSTAPKKWKNHCYLLINCRLEKAEDAFSYLNT